MTELDREQLRRHCADALEALHREQRVDGLAELADTIRSSALRTASMAS